MANEAISPNGFEFINGIEYHIGTANILLIAPHGVETSPLDDKKTAELTREIQRSLKCYAIINTDYRKPYATKESKRNGGIPDLENYYLDLNNIEQATLHPTFISKIEEVLDKNGSTYVFWIHGIDDDSIKDQAELLKNYEKRPNQLHALIGYGQGPDRSVSLDKRTGAQKKDSPSIEKETAERFAQLLTQNEMNTELTNPKGKNFCARSSKNMNQWFISKDYKLEQVRSLQLEIREEGFRKDDKIKDTAKVIADAISTLLPAVVVESKSILDDVDDKKVEKAYEHLKEIFVKHFQNAMLECGKYLIQTFYGGNYELAQKKKFTSNKSLSKLIKRIQEDATEKGNAPSRTWLYDAVNLAIDNYLCEQKVLPSVYGQLGHSHKVNLTSAPIEVKPALVREAFDKKYTVAELRDRIREEKKKTKSDESIDLFNLPHQEVLIKQPAKKLNRLKGRAEVLIQTYTDNLKTVKLAEELIKSAIETQKPSPAKLRKTIENNEWTVARNNVNFQTGCSNACIYCYGRFMFHAEKLKEEAEAQGKEFH